MQAQAQTKHEELVDTLLSYIDSGTPLEEPHLSAIRRDISALPLESRSYLTAWLMVALDKHDDAVEWFKDAIDTSGENASTVAGNYLAYLSVSAHNLFHKQEVFRLAKVFGTKRIRTQARNAAVCMGSEKLIKKYTLMLKALLDGEERSKIEREGEIMVETIRNFKEATKLTSADIEKLCDAAEQIANSHGVNCVGVEYFLSGDCDNALILSAQTSDASTLTTINLELMDLLTEEEYIDRPFTSWFKSEKVKGFNDLKDVGL
ncbi:hypothetical protein ACLIN0_11845 [Pantoea agglomerans]|uniref:hypothetical protein n=1 Tax=Enterobacter agglomerans TaxID=549 RepID=UPI0039889427